MNLIINIPVLVNFNSQQNYFFSSNILFVDLNMANKGFSDKSICSDNGYLGPYKLYNKDQLETLLNWIYSEYGFDFNVIKNPHVNDHFLLNKLLSQKLTRTIKSILGETIFIENMFIINKLSNSDFEVPSHQDGINPNLMLDYKNAISTWISLHPSLEKNGGLSIFPKSYKKGYIAYHEDKNTYKVNGATKEKDVKALKMNAGDYILMDTRLVHKSGQNKSLKNRCAVNIRWVNNKGIIKRIANHKLLLV